MKFTKTTLAMWAGVVLCGCSVGPNYTRPDAPVPTHYRELEGWKPAAPAEAASGTAWWSVFGDPVLNDLEVQVALTNQTLKQAEAAWREATAVTAQARASWFPTIDLSGSAQRSSSVGGSPIANQATAGGSLSWDLDVWGKIRRTVEADAASAQASAADLAAARLSEQVALATDYWTLRAVDEQQKLLDDTLVADQKALDIAANRYASGVAAKTDVITAQATLQAAQSQRIGLEVTRRQLEHAIAVLIGQPPTDFSLAPGALGEQVPVMPTDVPSTLLERRPDIASAERLVAAANAEIGVAIAGYFPDLSLTGSAGYSSGGFSHLIQAANRTWSLGGDAALTVLDFGARSAQVDQARAAYDATVATYRQTVLTAFQQVEDELVALRVLEEQAKVQQQTVDSANEALRLTLNQYKAGTVAYSAVVTAQLTALTDAQTLLTVRENRFLASVSLISALGGGWQRQDLDAPPKAAAPAGSAS